MVGFQQFLITFKVSDFVVERWQDQIPGVRVLPGQPFPDFLAGFDLVAQGLTFGVDQVVRLNFSLLDQHQLKQAKSRIPPTGP